MLDVDLLHRMTEAVSNARAGCLERGGYDKMNRADPRRAALVSLAKAEAENAVKEAGLQDVADEFAALSKGLVPVMGSTSRFVVRHAATEPAPSQADRRQDSHETQDEAFETADMLRAVDADAERLFSVLDHSGSMESVSIQAAVYRLRQTVAQAIGDVERASAAAESLKSLVDGEPDDDGENVSLRQGQRGG